MAHRLANISRILRVCPGWFELPNAAHIETGSRLLPSYVTRRTWHNTFPGIALLLAGVSTVCLCEDESKRTSAAPSAEAHPPTSNEHTAKWRLYTNKAAQLAKEHKLEDAEKYMSAALSEAIKGFGSDDPHVAAARQNLAEQYRVMHKYDMALPLYNEAVEALTRAYGLQDIRTATALHNLAGLHMAQKDSLAASDTMQRAIEAKRLALGPSHPAVVESVLGLAAIHRASGNTRDAVELLQKELNFLTKEGQASTPGVILLTRRLAEDQKEAGMLPEAEATCLALKTALSDDASRMSSDPLQNSISLELAHIVRAQGRLDEARQLCEQVNSQYSLAHIVRAQGRLDEARQLCEQVNSQYSAASHAGRYPGYWPALQLLVEIELEVGSQDSHLRALNRLQTFCGSMQALLEGTIAASGAESQTLWYMPSTWLGKWMKKEDSKVHLLNVVPIVAWLTEAQQYLAKVQSRLDRHPEAWATLRQAIDILQSPALAQIVESLESAQHTARLRARFARRKQDIHNQMSAAYESMCSPMAEDNREQCGILQAQLAAALAAREPAL